jgi:DNA repair photolyase
MSIVLALRLSFCITNGVSLSLDSKLRAGRGAVCDIPNRFEKQALDLDPDVVQPDPTDEHEIALNPKTTFLDDLTQSIITSNDSPDIRFDLSINPYRGCEHGCAYCYARPYHEYLGFSPGLEFETKIMVKRHAAELLRAELSKPKYVPKVLSMSGVTDCYQPAERRFKITRSCLQVLAEFRHPVSIITKNFLVTRDIDIFKEMAAIETVQVNISLTTLDPKLAAKMEPRASLPGHRLRAIEMLAEAGVPVGVVTAPIIPGLNDKEIPALLKSARAAGASSAAYTVLRLPYGVKDVFADWLRLNYPEKLERILDSVREMRGGKLNVSEFGARMKGTGHQAEQIGQIHKVFRERLGFKSSAPLRLDQFRKCESNQMMLDF